MHPADAPGRGVSPTQRVFFKDGVPIKVVNLQDGTGTRAPAPRSFDQGRPSFLRVLMRTVTAHVGAAFAPTEKTDPVELFMYVNKLARRQGIGRIDIVENRFVGIKSRGYGVRPRLRDACWCRSSHSRLQVQNPRDPTSAACRCYETPGGTVLRVAHMDIEGVVLDREVRRLRDMLAVRMSEIVYNGASAVDTAT